MSAGMMSARTMAAATQDPENIFELPECYRHVTALDRAAQPSSADLVFTHYTDILERRAEHRTVYENRIASALGPPQPLPVPATVMDGADFADPAALTPLQAAVVEVVALSARTVGMSVIDLWGGAQGLAFAFEAFVEYCRLTEVDDQNYVSPLPWSISGEPRPDVVRLLALTRLAPERDRAEVLAVATRLRQGEPSALIRALTTFLFPERPEWFWADLSAAEQGRLSPLALLPSVTTAQQGAALARHFARLPAGHWAGNPAVERAFLAGAGAEALPFLLAWCDSGHQCPQPVKGRPQRCPIHARCFEAIAHLPTDAALTALVARVDRDAAYENLHTAVLRFPRRAMRILAGSEPSEEIARLLAMIVLREPALARTVAGQLNPQASARIEALLADGQPVATTPLDLPELLAAPPWRDKKRKRSKPIVVEGLTPPADVKVAWLPGEREAWLARHGAGWVPENGWEAALTQVRDVGGDDRLATYVAAYGPEELVRPALDTWQPPLRMVTNRAQTFVAKYELAALPTLLAMNRVPAVRARLLQPFAGTDVAAIMVDGLVRLRSVRGFAAAWLRRHPEDAVRCLVPTALGKAGKTRQNTVAALRLLEGDGIDVAGIGQQAYGGDVGTAIKEVLADTGLDVYPRSLPEAPLWARAELLPEIRLKDGQTPLPRSAAQAVAEMLMFSKPDAPYPGLEIVKEICDASSLAEFAWSVFDSWDRAGASKEDSWAFGSLGLLGDEHTVTRLQKLIREWRAQSNYPRVIDGFDALGAIGGDRALTALHTFANLSWPLTLKRKARAKFDDVAHSMDLTAEQLADHTVPTLGLSPEGTLDLDYGTRRLTVSIDEVLRLVVTDENGSVLKAFPKPGKRDHPEVAPASYKRFLLLKKELQAVTQEQIGRLEQAMVGRRRWTPEDFSVHLVPHLLLGRIVRRLVWGVYAGAGELLGSFRIAEDQSFADIDDAHYEVPEGGLIGVAHPVDLAEALGSWSEVFADYEILQPFDQLGRPPLELSAEERAGKCLVRPYIYPDASATSSAAGQVSVPPAWFDQLVARGWQPGPIGADRLWSRLLRPVADGAYAVVEIVPGLEAGAAAQSDYQVVKAVWLSASGDAPEFETDALPLAKLNRMSASVVLRDLER